MGLLAVFSVLMIGVGINHYQEPPSPNVSHETIWAAKQPYDSGSLKNSKTGNYGND